MEEIKVADSRALEVVAREPDPKLSENALRVLQKRYLKKDEKGRVIETPKELFARVAWNLAQAERNYGAGEAQVEETARRFFRIISSLEFLPNSPTLMNAGLELQQLSACFVLPVDDSLAGIFHTLQEAALIHQSGGGTGFSFSRLRPKNDFVRSTMGVASGPVSFMKVYDAATQQVKQGSKRRGANMGILRVDHPDILDFITCKDKTSEITNFNISVAVTDEFLEAVKIGTKYNLANPRTKQVVGQLDAREVLDKIAFQAWKNGEPGLFFIDENNRRQPTPNVGDMEATNPCVTGDTLVSTELGLIPIAEIAERYPNGGISLLTDRRVAAEVVTESNGMLLASRDQAKASLAKADDDLSKTAIYSPIDGSVTRLKSQIGERVLGTQLMAGTEIMTIAELTEMEARVDIGEIDVVLISPGQNARLEVDAFKDRKFSGAVTEIANSSTTSGFPGATQNNQQEATKFSVKIRIKEKESFQD